MTEEYPGIYRGVVEEVEDVDERFRYRVRIHHIHPDEISVNGLPWAETVSFAGSGFGDVPHYETGDRVWVMFEGGNREYPVVMGGWIAKPGGIPDVPPEQDEKYSKTRRRWFRLDRKGNLVELSEVAGELHVRMRSGGAEVLVTQIGDQIKLKALEGRVSIEAKKANIKAEEFVAEGDGITVSATKRSGTTGQAVFNVFSTKTLNIYSGAIPGLDAASEILIGKFTDAAAVTRQTQLVRIEPNVVEIGKKDAGLPTLNVTIEGATSVNLKSNTLVDVQAPNVNVTGSTQVTIDGANEAKIKSATKVSVESSLVEVGLGGGVFVMLNTVIAKFNSHTHLHAAGTGAPIATSPVPVAQQFLATDATVNTKAT